jgi:hypothetical protein
MRPPFVRPELTWINDGVAATAEPCGSNIYSRVSPPAFVALLSPAHRMITLPCRVNP